ncbi:MAG: ribosome small subunit-dependent GTPase A [Chloroflexota bacterium]|nr:ribosome small subunit-dependent GTPase A [Chloroflexota bacterium]
MTQTGEHKRGQLVRLYAEVATVQVGDDLLECAIRGKLFKTMPPAVGDWVELEETGSGYAIMGVLPRKSVFARRAAGTLQKRQVLIANVDLVLVMFAAAHPDPQLYMLDRFLVAAETNDLEAHIVINKMDLVEREDALSTFKPYSDAGYPIHYVSVRRQEGLDDLRELLSMKESVFTGPSGVGKSSVLNWLYPGLNLKVGELSEAYGRGKHTTVGGLLIKLPGGASVADTAGLREVGLWMLPPDEIPHCFPELRKYEGHCRFNNCAHISEPDCAVREALEKGQINPARYSSYVKLREEAVETFPRW